MGCWDIVGAVLHFTVFMSHYQMPIQERSEVS